MKLTTLAGISLIGLSALSNNAFSQNNFDPEDSRDPRTFKPGAELGMISNKIINGNTTGITFGIYFNNSKFQLGYIAEINRKSKPMCSGKGIDLGKVGVEVDYFPTNWQMIKPYIGSEIKYEDESLFVGKENECYEKRGIGLEGKAGVEFKPFRDRKIRVFSELGYNFSFEKESKEYPENPETERDKIIGVLGIKF